MEEYQSRLKEFARENGYVLTTERNMMLTLLFEKKEFTTEEMLMLAEKNYISKTCAFDTVKLFITAGLVSERKYRFIED